VEVEGEGGGGGFAFLDGAGDEVGCDDLHCGGGGGVEVGGRGLLVYSCSGRVWGIRKLVSLVFVLVLLWALWCVFQTKELVSLRNDVNYTVRVESRKKPAEPHVM
jgi:Na+/melibiose symporter-like transporter